MNTINMQSVIATARKNRLTTREERNAYMRKKAREAYRAVRKLLPKKLRSAEVKAERDAMTRLSQQLLVGNIQEQGAADLAVKILAGAGAVSLVVNTFGKVHSLLSKADKVTSKIDVILEQVLGAIDSLKQQAQRLMGVLWVLPCAVLVYWLSRMVGDNTLMWAGLALILTKVFGAKLWRAGRAEATLSPQGGGRVEVRPGRPGGRKAPEARGSQIGQRRKAAREKTGGRRAGDCRS
jgi:hypothetical protein